MVHSLDATEEFYGALFGWEFRPGPQPFGPYVRALLDGREVAGIGLLQPDSHLPVAWTPYFASADIDRTAESVLVSCGGTIGVGPLDAAHAGRLAIGSDPSGAVFGVWQAAARLGAAVTGVPGAPAWHEVYDVRVGDRRQVLRDGVRLRRGAGGLGRLRLRHPPSGGRPVAGVHGVGNAVPRDRGPHWTTYFTVTDADDAVDHVLHLGGQVLKPARDETHGRGHGRRTRRGRGSACCRARADADSPRTG
ncbi:VOC domain-containing protein OS=Streptomyces griseomycini OX=66895 GN=FHS37_002508 PE=4 SV=1 [Streptomyces griseomycini]